ncbi:MAG: D-alanine--D-alanine ligase [Actinobacteria bacterium]|nr:D-alanine--D-alanine ligase [Actinomycetota bacterium]
MAQPPGRRPLVVLYGGRSAEHDVSRVTAAHVVRAVDRARYRVVPVGIDRAGGWHLHATLQASLDRAEETVAPPEILDVAGPAVEPFTLLADGDPIVLPLLHGPNGEDGTVQGLLELADVPYVGSAVLASALAMDKAMAKHVCAGAGIPQPAWTTWRADRVPADAPDVVGDLLGYPCFVKPANLGSSVGVTKVSSPDGLRAALEVALAHDDWVVVEEAIVGREVEVAVLGNLTAEASVPGEIVPGAEFYDYADKYHDGRAELHIPARVDSATAARLRELAVLAYETLRCEGMARVDFFVEETGAARGPLLNEVNTIPGFTPISMYPKMWQASGMPYERLVQTLLDLAEERHERRAPQRPS